MPSLRIDIDSEQFVRDGCLLRGTCQPRIVPTVAMSCDASAYKVTFLSQCIDGRDTSNDARLIRERKMSNTAKALIFAGLVALLPATAEARGLSPGHYSLSGIQSICLQADGNWYGTTFANWGGHWIVLTLGTVKTTYIYGNYLSGAGNDSLVVLGLHNSKWTEWRDDLTFETVIHNVTVTKLSKFCPAAAATGKATRGPNPAN